MRYVTFDFNDDNNDPPLFLITRDGIALLRLFRFPFS